MAGYDIDVQTKILPSNDPASPPLVLRVTKMVNTYMLWIGIASKNDEVDGDRVVSEGKLCRDWACAMPPRTVRTNVAHYDHGLNSSRSRRCLLQPRPCFDRQTQMLHYRWHNV